jgi:hypothetical protein
MDRFACLVLTGLGLIGLLLVVLAAIEYPRFGRAILFSLRSSGYLLMAWGLCIAIGWLASAIGWIAPVLAVGFVVLILVICIRVFLVVRAITTVRGGSKI